ncbi:TPA: hypothetical protein ACHQNF_002307 [Pseudomonas aeruginosa]
MYQLFSGPYYDYVRSQEPLCGAEYFAHGSSAMLFQRDGNLYRLTTDGCGHGFLAEQSAKGNPSVVHVIKDFGPLAPSDNYGDLGVYYWLAQVERMEPIDPNSLEGASLNAILLSLTKGESSVDPADRPQFLINCEAAAAAHEEFAPLLRTLIQAENCLFDEEGLVDANITNVMRRPTTGELAWVDPINEAIGTLTEAQEAEMDRVKELVRAEAAA